MKEECGICENCKVKLEPVYFRERESYIDSYGHLVWTGRSRRAIDYLVCPVCLKRYIVDGEFGNGSWYIDRDSNDYDNFYF